MTDDAAFAACEAIVRRADPDRYFSALFAPAEVRPQLFALYAFNHELAHVGEAVRQPMLADIRLEWWREGIEGARAGKPRAHDALRGLSSAFAATALPLEMFEEMIAARRFDVGTEAFADISALEAYADATAGNLMGLAALLLGEPDYDRGLVRDAGRAYALMGLLRVLPFHKAHGKARLPQDLVARSGEAEAVAAIRERALSHHRKAHGAPKLGAALPAILPAALVPLYAKASVRGANDVAQFRKQWTLLKAATRGRV